MLAKLKNTYLQFGYNFPLLIAFFLPFGINYAVFILLWLIGFFLFEDLNVSFKRILNNKWSYVILAFFFLHAIGFLFSQNKSDALTAIEIKLCFLAFPILIFGTKYTEIQVRKIIITFVSGCFLACMFCLFRAFYLYLFEDFNAFFYSEFTYFMHPSYFAMYLIFAMLIVMLFYPKWLTQISNLYIKIGFLTIIFLICIFLCSSKMGLITALLLLPATLFIILFRNGYKKLILGLSACLVLGIFASYKLFPRPFDRIKVAFSVTSSIETIDKTDAESTAVRILIWKESIKLIKEHVLLGVTPGDVNDQLCKAYTDNGLTGALRKRLNAHNQFLQTFLGTGIIGFMILLIMTVFAMVFGFIKKNYILGLFSALMVFNFLVESMLQAQAGFVFFVFFLCFILAYDFSKNGKSVS